MKKKSLFIWLISLTFLIFLLGLTFFLFQNSFLSFFGKDKQTSFVDSDISYTVSSSYEDFISVPRVFATNISERKELVYNASVSLVFTQEMDRESVEDSFSINPRVAGSYSWNNEKTFVFTPQSPFDLESEYQVSLNEDAKNVEGELIASSFSEKFTTIESPKVLLATPEGEVHVDSKLTVMFDRPMFALSTLDVSDAYDYPLKLNPEIEGRFRLVGTSSFQFIPKTGEEARFPYSTHFTAKIPAGFTTLEGGVLEEDYTMEFKTPRLELTNRTYDLKTDAPFILYFNQPIDLSKFKEKFIVQDSEGEEIDYSNVFAITKYYSQGKEQEKIHKNIIEIRKLNGEWGYDNQYRFQLQEGLFGVEGNMSSESSFDDQVTVHSFVDHVFPDGNDRVGSHMKPEITFHEEVQIEGLRELISFSPSISFDVHYVDECKEYYSDEEIIETGETCKSYEPNKKKVRIIPSVPFVYNQNYAIKIRKDVVTLDGRTPMGKDFSIDYTISDAPQVLGLNHSGGYKYFCLFSNNPIQSDSLKKGLQFEPPHDRPIYGYSYKLTYNDYRSRYYDDPCNEKEYEGKYATRVSTQLNPETEYTLKVTDELLDQFNQPFVQQSIYAFVTGEIQSEDTDISLLQDDFYLYSPSNSEIVIQSTNLNEIDIELCKLDFDQYINIDKAMNNPYRGLGSEWNDFSLNGGRCKVYEKIHRELPVIYWDPVFSKIDIKEALGIEEYGMFYVRITSPLFKSEEYKWEETGRVKVGERPRKEHAIILISESLLFAKKIGEKSLVWALNAFTGDAIDALSLNFYDQYGTRLQSSMNRDENGIYTGIINGDWRYLNAYKEGEKNNNTFVQSSWNTYISPLGMPERGEGGSSYVFTERPIYRPSQVVYFKGIFRDEDDVVFSIPESKLAQVRIFDSMGVEVFVDNELVVSSDGTVGGELTLKTDASLGDYRLELCLLSNPDNCSHYANTIFSVEEYRKPEYKLDVLTEKDDYQDNDLLSVNFQSAYYFGVPFTGDVKWNVRTKTWRFDRFTDGNYSFEENEDMYWPCRFCVWPGPYGYQAEKEISQGIETLDNDGNAYISFPVRLEEHAPETDEEKRESLEYIIEGTVEDESDQRVFAKKHVFAHKGEYYVGVKTRDFAVQVGETMGIDLVSVDPTGNPVSGKKIKVHLLYKERVEIPSEEENDFMKHYYFPRYLTKEVEVDMKEAITESDGKVSIDFLLEEDKSGEYEVFIESMDDKEHIMKANTFFYASAKTTVPWYQEDDFQMDVFTDKQEYKVGESITMFAKSPFDTAKGLVTMERGDIYDYKFVDFNESVQKVTMQILDRYVPNVFMSVIAFQPGENPDFKMGIANVLVNKESKTLFIDVRADKEAYLPGETMVLTINTNNFQNDGVPADISVRVTDASVLALKKDIKTMILDFFYYNRDYYVSNIASLTKKLKIFEIEETVAQNAIMDESMEMDGEGMFMMAEDMAVMEAEAPMAKSMARMGSSAPADSAAAKKRTEFKDTAYFKAISQTNESGEVILEVPLPDNLTTWNIEVIGVSKDTLVGSAEMEVKTKKDVFVRPQLPRFVRLNDEFGLAAIIHNETEKEYSIQVDLQVENLELVGESSQNITLEAGSHQRVSYHVKVPPQDLPQSAIVTLKSQANGFVDEVEMRIPILHFATKESVATSSYTDDVSFNEVIRFPQLIEANLGSMQVTVGATLATFLNDSLNYLIAYPYGCNEQIMSRLLPAAVLKHALQIPNFEEKFQLNEIRDEYNNVISLEEMMKRGLTELYLSQRYDGGWGYFKGSYESSPYLTSYIVYGLHKIREAGFDVKENVLEDGREYMLRYLESREDLRNTENKIESSYQASNRAYMLFVLSELGVKNNEMVEEVYTKRDMLNLFARAYLTMTLQTLGKDGKVSDMIQYFEKHAKIDPRGTYFDESGYSYLFMTNNIKTTALIFQALTREDEEYPLIPRIMEWLIKNRRDGHWDTTQDTMTAIIAFTEYLNKTGETEAEYSGTITLNKEILGEIQVNKDTILERYAFEKPIKELALDMADNVVQFTKDGSGRLYYDIVLEYFLPIEVLRSRNEGIEISREYFVLDDTYLENPVTEMKRGEIYRGKLVITVTEERNMVVVENPLPAGLELLNFSLETTDKSLERAMKKKGNTPIPVDIPILEDFVSSRSVSSEIDCYDCIWHGDPFVHTEMRDDKLLLYSERLHKGVYEYEFMVKATSNGVFRNPPAFAFEMYFPEVFGRTRGEVIEIKE